MSKKPKRFDPRSRWVKYDKKSGLWFPSRKRVYLYWFKFLQIAEQDPDQTVDWSKYRGWGGSNEILGQKFGDWWKDHKKTLFAVQKEGDKPKFPLTTQNLNLMDTGLHYWYMKTGMRDQTGRLQSRCRRSRKEGDTGFKVSSMQGMMSRKVEKTR